jgi:hypothetical protein
MNIGLGGRNKGIRISGATGDTASVFDKPDGDASLRIGSLGHGVHVKECKRRFMGVERLDGIEDRIDRTITAGNANFGLAINRQFKLGTLRAEISSSTSASMSSSNTCFFLSARSLKRRKASSMRIVAQLVAEIA